MLVSVAIFAAGFCVVGGQIAANALAAGFYPTSVRATGVGWALGIGRVGSIIGPLVGGLLLAAKWSTSAVFMVAAAAALCAALAALSLSRLVRSDAGAGRASSIDAKLKEQRPSELERRFSR
jgi:AAHS family 4-hydroxybenzoate transporter-like MFS transporter